MDFLFVVNLLIGATFVNAAIPEWKRKLGEITVPFCSPGRTVLIELDAVTDAEDGTNLQLQLLDATNLPYRSNKYNSTFLNPLTRTLYIVPMKEYNPTSTVSLKIRAIDSDGNYADNFFTIVFTGTVPTPVVLFDFTFLVEAEISQVESYYMFLSKVGAYWKTTTLAIHEAVSFSQSIVKIMDCKYDGLTCPLQEIQKRSYEIISDGYNQCPYLFNATSGTFAKRFTDAMTPDFTVDDFQTEKLRSCTAEPNSPQFNFMSEFTVPRNFILLNLTGVHELVIPNDIANDEVANGKEDLTGMCVLLYDKKGSHVSGYDWIAVSPVGPSSVTKIYVLITDATRNYISIPGNFIERSTFTYASFILRFVGAGGGNVETEYYVKVPKATFTFYYSVTFSFKVIGIAYTVYPLQVKEFLRLLHLSFGIEYKYLIYMRHYTLTSFSGSDGEGTLQWSLVMENCDFVRIKYLQSIMFSGGTINENFKQKLAGVFQIFSIIESLTGKCERNKPYVNTVVPTLQIPYCGVFQYKIQPDTFFDQEDGNSTHMTLRLVKQDRSVIGKEEFIQFVALTQTVVAVLPVKVTFPKSVAYRLIVTDSSGLEAETAVNINIVGSPVMPPYEFQLASIYTASVGYENINPAYLFASKVSLFFNDDGAGFQLIESKLSSDGEQFITFGNCSWRKTPCDVYNLQRYKQTLLNANNVLKQEFFEVLKPEFAVPSYTLHKPNPPCDDDRPPSLTNKWGPLLAGVCSTFEMKIPENTFRDVEQGDTRNLQCEVLDSNGATLPSNSFTRYHQSTQMLTIVATGESPKQVKLKMIAKDINNNEAEQELIVNIQNDERESSHVIQVRITKVPAIHNNLVSVHNHIRSVFKEYFIDKANTFEFLSSTTLVNGFTEASIYDIKWSNCTVSRTVCQTEKINYIKERLFSQNDVSPSLKRFLKGKFEISNMVISDEGICKEIKQRPSVKAIPDQSVSFCGYLLYEIPENTFQDNIDGGTRALELSMTFEDGKTPSSTHWVYFDKSSQTVIALPSDANEAIDAFSTYTFTITAKTKRGVSASTKLNIKVSQERKKISYTFETMSLKTDSEASTTFKMKQLIDKVATFYGKKQTDFYIVEASVDTNFFKFAFMSCTARYEPCDWDYIDSVMKVSDDEGVPSQAIKNAFQPQFALIKFGGYPVSVAGRSKDICRKNPIPPEYVNHFKPFRVQQCRSFLQSFGKKTFIDEEDGSDLYLLVKKINDQFMTKESSWIDIDNYQFYGVSPDHLNTLVKDQSFNVTVRATDSDGLGVDGVVIVTAEYHQITSFYSYEMELAKLDTSDSVLKNKVEITNYINKFFGASVIHIITYSENSVVINMKWTHCGLPNYCSNEQVDAINKEIFSAETDIKTDFVDAFKPKFKLKGVKFNQEEACKKPLNPPASAFNPYRVTLPVCGGFDLYIPENLFTDQEDGDTRNLKLQMKTSSVGSHDVSSQFSWMMFDTEKQRLYGYPTFFQATDYNFKNVNLTLVATDSSGLSTDILVIIRFDLPAKPKYFFTFLIETSLQYRSVAIGNFVRKVADFSGDTDLKHIGLQETKLTSTGSSSHSITISFYNCSISYQPCNWALLQTIKSTFSALDGKPTSDLTSFFSPTFHVQVVTAEWETPCGVVAPEPPFIVNRLIVGQVFMCSLRDFQLDKNTFYDNIDGNTRNLKVSLSSDRNGDWINFIQKQQTLNWFIQSSLIKSQPTGGYSFKLTATDSSQLSVSQGFNIDIYGPHSLLEECQIEMELASSTAFSGSNYDVTVSIMKSLMAYFQLSHHNLGIIRSIRKDSFTQYISWSYCSSLYQRNEYRTNSQTLEVDSYNLITKVLMLLFQNDRRTIQSRFYAAFGSSLIVKSVKTVFTGRCGNLPPIVPPNVPAISITIDYGGYGFYSYQTNIFYDFEDGNAYQLSLAIVMFNGQFVSIENWVNIDQTVHTIYAVVSDYVRYLSQSAFTFYLRATDTGGLFATLKINIIKTGNIYQFSPFNITYQLHFHGQSNLVYVNQSSYVINQITNYFAVSKLQFILMRWYYEGAGLSTRYITWSIADHTCASTVLATVKTLSSQTGALNSQFAASFRNLFTLKRIYYQTNCQPPVEPPFTIGPITLPNITFCNFFSYQLTSNMFFDDAEGELPNLALHLLDSSGRVVSSSSWIQLNSASLTIYAIAIRSVFQQSSSYQFQLRATNSGGLSSKISFGARISNEPFTSDCPITMTFQYKYLTEKTVDLDVLWKVLQMIKAFYKDNGNSVKVLSFTRLNKQFTIRWSNCSSFFQFSSLAEAKFGMTESAREQISLIFGKVVTSVNVVTSAFQTYMSTYFQIISMSASYCCIEKPPVAKFKERRATAEFCTGFYEKVPGNAFYDECEGYTENLHLSLHYVNGQEVDINNWLQLDKTEQVIYGVLTDDIRIKAPTATGFRFLVSATDSSGRSSNYTFIVNVAAALPSIDNLFMLGFGNNYAEMVPTARILYDTRATIATLINGNDNHERSHIYVKRFTPPSNMVWASCSLKSCSAVKQILQTLQTNLYETAPNGNFISKLSPNVVPNYIQVYPQNSKCAETNFTIIINPITPTVPLPSCGNFTFKFPDKLFYDARDRRTSDFTLTVTTSNNMPLTQSSWIQFDTSKQTIYGLLIFNQLSEVSTYKVTATHPVSAFTASTTITVTYPSYKPLQAIAGTVCQITTVVESTYKTNYNDIYTLRKFVTTMSSYLKMDSTRIQIISYAKNAKYPTQWTIIWTDCKSTSVLRTTNNGMLYYQSLKTFLSNLFVEIESSVTTVHQEIYRYFQTNSYFTIKTITLSTECEKPPNTPPVIIQQIPDQELSCGMFEMRVPENAFRDEQDGNTKNLKLELRNFDDSKLNFDTTWIFIDNEQNIKALPDNSTLSGQPQSGYKYLLVASDSEGLQVTMVITVKLKYKTFKPTEGRVLLFATNYRMSPYRVEDKILLLKKIAPSEVFIPFRQLTYKNLFYADGTLFISRAINAIITHCDCNLNEGKTVSEISVSIIKQRAAPDFVIANAIRSINLRACDDVLFMNVNQNNQTMEYCRYFELNLVKEFQIPPEALKNYAQFVFKNEKDQDIASDSWVWYNPELYSIEAFPRETYWRDVAWEAKFRYWLQVIGTDNPQTKTNFSLWLLPRPNNIEAIKYSIVLETSEKQTQPDAYYISKTIRKLQLIISNYNVTFCDFQTLPSSGFKFSVTWKICVSLELCHAINKILFTNRFEVSLEVVQAFQPDYTVSSITGDCQQEAPQAPKELNLTVYTCGVFEYKLPNSFAFDLEDGDLRSLEVTLTNYDGSALRTSSWIKYLPNIQTILAIPTETVVNTLFHSKIQYLLLVKDSDGHENTTTVNIHIVNDRISYYKVTLVFRSLLPESTDFIDLQYSMLQTVSIFTGDNTLEYYQLVEFRKIVQSTNNFYMQIGNCSIAKTACRKDYLILDENEKKMQEDDRQFTSEFQKAVKGLFVGVSVQFTKLFETNKAPVIIDSFSVELESCCNAKKMCIANSSFSDEDITLGKKLALTLENQNNEVVDSTSFVQIHQHCIYVIPTVTAQGSYTFKLKAKDSCSEVGEKEFTVTLRRECRKDFAYENQVVFQPMDGKSAMETLYDIRGKILDYFSDNSDNLSLVSYNPSNQQSVASFSNCSILYPPCHHKEITNVLKKMKETELQDQLSLMAELKAISGKKREECETVPPPKPKTNFTKLIYNVTFCEKVDLVMPENVFYGDDGTNTRDFQLILLDNSKTKIPFSYWIQLDQSNQKLYGYPRVSSGSPERRYDFYIRATNAEGGMIDVLLCIYIEGDLPNIDYQLTINAVIEGDFSQPDVYYEMLLLTELSSYFSRSDLNDISLVRNSRFPANAVFKWSFCNVRRKPCDCMFVKNTQSLIDENNMVATLTSRFAIQEISYSLSGHCANNQFPQLVNSLVSVVEVTIGQPFSVSIPSNIFYDAEDGATSNLTLSLRDENGVTLQSTAWIGLNNFEVCGLLQIFNYQEQSMVTRKTYSLVATDGCGKEAADTFTIQFTRKLTSWRFSYVMLFNMPYEVVTECKELGNFIKSIAEFSAMPTNNIYMIRINPYDASNITANQTLVEWTFSNISEPTCSEDAEKEGNPKIESKLLNNTIFTFMQLKKIPIENFTLTCKIITTPTTIIDPNTEFDWVPIIIIAVILFLIILAWLLWICLPRLCPGCCIGRVCEKCCARDGALSSYVTKGFENDDLSEDKLPLPATSPSISSHHSGPNEVIGGPHEIIPSPVPPVPVCPAPGSPAPGSPAPGPPGSIPPIYKHYEHHYHIHDATDIHKFNHSDNYFVKLIDHKDSVDDRHIYHHYHHRDADDATDNKETNVHHTTSDHVDQYTTDSRHHHHDVIYNDHTKENHNDRHPAILPSIESWKDPRPVTTATTTTTHHHDNNDSRYMYYDDRYYFDNYRDDSNRHHDRQKHVLIGRHDHHIPRRPTIEDTTDMSSQRHLVLLKNAKGYDDSYGQDVTLTVPRQFIEKYLENRFRRRKGLLKNSRRSHQHHVHYRQPIPYTIKETSELADALVDDHVISPRPTGRGYLHRSSSFGSLSDLYGNDLYRVHDNQPRVVRYVRRRKRRRSPRKSRFVIDRTQDSSSRTWSSIGEVERQALEKRYQIRKSGNSDSSYV